MSAPASVVYKRKMFLYKYNEVNGTLNPSNNKWCDWYKLFFASKGEQIYFPGGGALTGPRGFVGGLRVSATRQ
ncbi:hypothetical protein ACVGXS_06450, partial [Enterobacter hormaechei]